MEKTVEGPAASWTLFIGEGPGVRSRTGGAWSLFLCFFVALKRGELLRLVPCMLVWHHQKNIFFLLDRAKLKLKTSNIYVTMKKKHSGQAPTLLVLIWDLSQFWPCHTNMLGFFKSLLSRNFCSEICWECLKNILLDIDEFQAEEASSLLILKAIFLSKCHTNILSWPIHELHISRGNIFFAVDFLFDQWNQLRLMFFLLPFYTFHLESYLCHTNTGFLCMATGKQSSLTGAMQIHEVTIGSDLSMKKKNLPTDPFFKAVEIKESRKRSSVVPSLDGNLE